MCREKEIEESVGENEIRSADVPHASSYMYTTEGDACM